MTRTPEQIVAEFDALEGVGEGHFIDEMETAELRLLIEKIKRLRELLNAAARILEAISGEDERET